ncbi:MAG: hypothetical protein ACI31F_01180 [Muribaculaceae bacterium]
MANTINIKINQEVNGKNKVEKPGISLKKLKLLKLIHVSANICTIKAAVLHTQTHLASCSLALDFNNAYVFRHY